VSSSIALARPSSTLSSMLYSNNDVLLVQYIKTFWFLYSRPSSTLSSMLYSNNDVLLVQYIKTFWFLYSYSHMDLVKLGPDSNLASNLT
jgi:hypothetical protein